MYYRSCPPCQLNKYVGYYDKVICFVYNDVDWIKLVEDKVEWRTVSIAILERLDAGKSFYSF
jgi:hypothetical protein